MGASWTVAIHCLEVSQGKKVGHPLHPVTGALVDCEVFHSQVQHINEFHDCNVLLVLLLCTRSLNYILYISPAKSLALCGLQILVDEGSRDIRASALAPLVPLSFAFAFL